MLVYSMVKVPDKDFPRTSCFRVLPGMGRRVEVRLKSPWRDYISLQVVGGGNCWRQGDPSIFSHHISTSNQKWTIESAWIYRRKLGSRFLPNSGATGFTPASTEPDLGKHGQLCQSVTLSYGPINFYLVNIQYLIFFSYITKQENTAMVSFYYKCVIKIRFIFSC